MPRTKEPDDFSRVGRREKMEELNISSEKIKIGEEAHAVPLVDKLIDERLAPE